ncbi:hypothetical protein LINPERHAP2_LOCUS28643 [Linum perenne]
MIQKLATKSESVIDTYRRDLEELGSSLRKEIIVIYNIHEVGMRRTGERLRQGVEAAPSDGGGGLVDSASLRRPASPLC